MPRPSRTITLLSATLTAVLISICQARAAEPPAPATPEMATYTWLKKHVFGRCIYCHAERRDLPYFFSYTSTLGVVSPGDPMNSRLYQMVASGRMPKGPRLNEDKINAIYWWIKHGAQDN